jgi:arylsulfatase A-like enzyme
MQDVMPTALELAGKPIPQQVQFKSLLPLIRGERTEQYPSIYGAYTQAQRMVRQGDFKLIVYPKPLTFQLFDLKSDPYETINLADNPAYAEKIKKLLAELRKLQKEAGDPLTLDF